MKTRSAFAPYLFLLPALALYAVLVLYPLALLLSLSLTLYNWDGLSQKVFVGLANFRTRSSKGHRVRGFPCQQRQSGPLRPSCCP